MNESRQGVISLIPRSLTLAALTNADAEDEAMKCQYCDNAATVHLTDILNKKKRETHLCENCARDNQLIPAAQQDLDVPALLQFLLGQAAAPPRTDVEHAMCPQCGMKFAQFRAQGKLGCPGDYAAFHDELEALLDRIHRHTNHDGKVPARRRAALRTAARDELTRQLQSAVREERFEDAVDLRDQLRQWGTPDEPR